MLKHVFLLNAVFFLTPAVSYPQDCCGPGGGGGGISFAASEGGEGCRLKGVRHYAYSQRHPGFTAGLEAGGITDKADVSFTPRLEYANVFGNFEVYGGAFYTVFLDAPHSHQIDLSENLAWRIALTDNTRLVFRVDNEDVIVFFPEDTGLKYAAVDPSVDYNAALRFGDLSVSAGFPVIATPESGQSSLWFCAGYEHPIGLGVSLCPRFSLLPDAAYSGTTLTLTFAWDRFFAKAAFLANADFTDFQIRPYIALTLWHIVLWTGVDLAGLGSGGFSVNLFIGAGYHFEQSAVMKRKK